MLLKRTSDDLTPALWAQGKPENNQPTMFLSKVETV